MYDDVLDSNETDCCKCPLNCTFSLRQQLIDIYNWSQLNTSITDEHELLSGDLIIIWEMALSTIHYHNDDNGLYSNLTKGWMLVKLVVA